MSRSTRRCSRSAGGTRLAEHPQEAVSILFELEGAAHASSSALEQVLACSLGLDVPPAAGLVLPPLGRRCPPGELDGAQLVVRGLGTVSLLAPRRPWWWRRR